MVYGADTVAIAATSSGVTGTITVPAGVKLKQLTFAYAATTNLPEIITIIELTWANAPTPLRFTPNMWSFKMGTPAASAAISLISDEEANNPCHIPLDVIVKGATTVTVKVTSSGNLAVKVGLEWE
jgi:hypothetical protein